MSQPKPYLMKRQVPEARAYHLVGNILKAFLLGLLGREGGIQVVTAGIQVVIITCSKSLLGQRERTDTLWTTSSEDPE
jgi:hypothetical protein